MNRSMLIWPTVRAGTVGVVLFASSMSEPATGSTFPLKGWRPIERTAAAPPNRVKGSAAQSIPEAVLEIRRRSGLTWEELAELFGVTRRSVHHWASGKQVSSKNDRFIRQVLDVIQRLDLGESIQTRAVLLQTRADGNTLLGLIRERRFDEAKAAVELSTRAAPPPRTPLSAAVTRARRPFAPHVLLGGSDEAVEVFQRPSRIARTLRIPRPTD